MAVLLHQLIDDVEHEAGAALDPRLDPTAIVNEAGRHLFALANWRFRQRPPALLDFVASQAYVALPSDFGFGELVSVCAADNATRTVELTSLDQVDYLRGIGGGDVTGRYYVALAFPTQATVTAAPAQARLEIYPTPSANETGALRAIYRAGWVELAAMTSAANVPPQFEGLLRQVVRALTVSYVESDPSRLNDLGESAMVLRLKRSDAASMVESAPMYGGVLQPRHSPVGHEWSTVTHPT